MRTIIKLIVNGIAVYVSASLITGVDIADFMTAIIAALVFALVNTFIKPIIMLLTFPITLVTLGLFKLVINACLVLLVAYLVQGFVIAGFLQALLFALLYSIISTLISVIAKD